MNEEINLLKETHVTASPLLSRFFALRTVSLFLLFGVSFFSICIFILIALSPLPRLQEQENEEVQKITFFHPKIAKMFLTKERLSSIRRVIQTRPVYHDVLEQVALTIPSAATVDSMKLEESKLTFSVSSQSLGALDMFIAQLQELNKKKKYFTKVSLLSLYLNTERGRYIAVVEMVTNVKTVLNNLN